MQEKEKGCEIQMAASIIVNQYHISNHTPYNPLGATTGKGQALVSQPPVYPHQVSWMFPLPLGHWDGLTAHQAV